MRNHSLFNSLISTALGLSVLCPAAALALSQVTYTASATFILNPSGNPNQDFGIVTVRPTSLTGWELQVRSNEGGALRHSDHPSTIPYNLIVGNSQVGNLTGQDITVLTDLTNFCQTVILIECTIPIQANIAAHDITGKPAGSYSDTLTFTVVDKPL
ncbi:hypothetical protein [Nodosilinea sp. E11]|uniref:hypothetical protein n=1 Tax=Nodosilinea sp. E11 TaxID=3037479 RepID=UPI0029347BED|nr:hypothetical protein [Nodosilinea sp. E11]WOD41167.1 hypothetical protein RRF56_10225 [Nodosilinea sp. E11]